MFQSDWCKAYTDFAAVITDLGLEPAKVLDITPERIAEGLWIDSATDTTYIKGEHEFINVFVWNHPGARLEIAKQLLQPVWRL